MCIKKVLVFLGILTLVALGVATPAQRVMADDESWHAEYFDNQTLDGWPHHTQTDQWIGFDWGTDGPAGLASDHFSIRWTRPWWLSYDGIFQFCAMVDDGVRIRLDDVLVLDEWHGSDSITYCGSQYKVLKGEHEVSVEYYEDGGDAKIYMWWEEVESHAPAFVAVVPPLRPAVSTPSLATVAPAPFDGWYGEYFGNRTLSGRPDQARVDPWIGFEWGLASPFSETDGEWFSVRWRRSGWFDDGHYRFCATSDDGVRIWVDGDLVLDEWHDSNGLSYCGTRYMTKGAHQVHVEYYENQGYALIYVWWERDFSHRWR
jgi:hypothetical protein